MSNHGTTPFPMKDNRPEFQRSNDMIRRLADVTGFKGALGAFPEGKLTGNDEGAIQFAMGEANGKVVIDFGTQVHWLGMTPQQAAEFASALLKKAKEVGRKNGETVALVIG